MSGLRDLMSSAARLPGNMCYADGGTTNGTNAGTIKTTVAVPYTLDGIWYSKAITDNIALAAPSSSLLPNDYDRWRFYSIGATDVARTFYLVFALDSSGNVVTFQGAYSGQDLTFRGGGVAKGDGLIPNLPDGVVPFAIAKVANPASLAFVPGTTALTTASGRTVTFYDIAMLPSVTSY